MLAGPYTSSNFVDIVEKTRSFHSRAGFSNNIKESCWELLSGSISFTKIAEIITPRFLDELKKCLSDLIAAGFADATIIGWYYALRDLLRYTFASSDQLLDCFRDSEVIEWAQNPSSATYPSNFKVFVANSRKLDRTLFPTISKEVLTTLPKQNSEVSHVLSLHPRKGPWLEGEVLIQDVAIERAYASGAWTPEVYVLVELLRKYGMRVGSLARMKGSDVRTPSTDEENRAEVRWPFLKSDNTPDEAIFWPLRGPLLAAMEDYLEERFADVPQDQRSKAPLFTPCGLPGSFQAGKRAKGSREVGYEGHVTSSTMTARFRHKMLALGLKTSRSGKEIAMEFNPHRERHTVGVRYALKGHSAEEIALLLGHARSVSTSMYVDLATLCMQLRDPKFYHLLDGVGAVYENPCVSKDFIQKRLDPIISAETSTKERLSLVGGGKCNGCHFAGASDTAEPWPCLSCNKFHIYEDADLQPLWNILQDRKTYMSDPAGNWNSKYDADIHAQFLRYEILLVSAEMHRRNEIEKRTKNKEQMS